MEGVPGGQQRPSVMYAPTSDADWFAQVQHWRSESSELKAQLHRTEHVHEERLRELQQRSSFDSYQRDLASQDSGAALLAGARKEMERLSRSNADWQERSRRSDERVTGLLTESEQAADLMAQLTVQFEHQVEISSTWKRKLIHSEAETEKIRAELELVMRREAEKATQYDRAESTIGCIIPRLTEEVKVEARMAEEAQEVRRRLQRSESMFNAQAMDLVAEVNQSQEEQRLLGRKCAESYKVAAQHANAGLQWQQRSRAAEEELIRAGLNQHHLWEAAKRTRAEQWAQQEQLRAAEEQRDRAMYNHVVADKARRELTGWMVSSLDEVNRSAHSRSSGFPSKEGKEAFHKFQGEAWVDMLETFRQDQQTRNGFGARTRGPM